MKRKEFRNKVRSGKVCLGTHSYSASPAIVEIIGHSGFDWVMIDCEHAPIGPYDTLALENLLRAAETSGTVPLVRVPKNDPVMIMKVLDSGAAGIIVPHVNDKASAELAVGATRYPPVGLRGTCPHVRSVSYYARRPRDEDYWRTANEEITTVLLLEDRKAVDNIEDIVSVPGVDVVYLGTTDMAMDMGEFRHDAPRVKEAVAHVTKVARAHGVAVGQPFFYPNVASAKALIDLGHTFLACTADLRIFGEACAQINSGVDELLKSHPAKPSRT